MTSRVAVGYLMVSGICLLVHNFVIIAMHDLGFHLVSAVIASFVVVVAVGYLLHCRLTFGERMCWSRFQKYAGAMAANVPLAYMSIWLLHEIAGFEMIWASPIASVVMVLVNYLLSRWAIVMPKSSTE